MNSRMRKHAALAVVTLAAAGALTLAACTETPAASSDAPAIQNQSKSEESMTNERNGGYATISEDEAVAMMSENSTTLVDVRTAREYADGHIPGAINIPVETIGSVKPAGLQGVDENASIIVYCRTGVRSEHASNMLLNLGYKHVFDLGGIVDWNGEKVAGTEPGSFAGDAQ